LNEHDDLMIGRQGMKYNNLTKYCSHKFFSGENVPIMVADKVAGGGEVG